MSDPAAVAQRQQVRERSFVASVITFPFRFFGVLCGSLLLCILVEWVGMHLFWPDQGWRHAQGMVSYELEQLSTYFTRSIVVEEPGRTAHWFVNTVYEWVFVKTGVMAWVQDTAAQARAGSEEQARNLRYYVSQIYVHVESYLLSAAYTLLVFLVRLLVLCLMLPLFMMAGFVGLVDGLVRRDIRRFGAGRESGFVYHRAKATLMPLMVMPWMVYLALPVSISPIFILLPTALLLGIAVNIAAGSFKKYL